MATKIVINNVQVMPVISVVLMLLGLASAYFIAVGMEKVDPVIPFISHVAAYPPQTGVVLVPCWAGGILAVASVFLRHFVVRHRAAVLNQGSYIEFLNEASAWCGVSAIVACLVVVLVPCGFPCGELWDFVFIVAIPHHVADLCVLIPFSIYVTTQTYLSYSQRVFDRKLVTTHFAMLITILLGATGIIFTIYPAIKHIFADIVARHSETGMIELVYTKYGFSSAVCASSEWIFVSMSFIYIATFYQSFKHMRIKFHIKSKC